MQPENAAHRWHSGEVTDDTPFNERPTAVINEFNDEVAREFRANGGEVGGQFAGVPILLLTNTGAKSGQQRLNPLAYFNIDGKIYIVGSFGGADKDPAWVHNLRANPHAHIDIGTDGYDVVAHELSSPSVMRCIRRWSSWFRCSPNIRRRPPGPSRSSSCAARSREAPASYPLKAGARSRPGRDVRCPD